MSRTRRTALGLVPLLLAFTVPGCSGTKSPTAAVSGLVLDPSGNPLAGADVSLLTAATAVKTDATGHFAFADNRMTGNLVFRFSATGYGRSWVRRAAELGQEQSITVQLKKSGVPHDVVLPAAGAAAVTVTDGTSGLSIPPGALCKAGVPIDGHVNVSFYRYESNDPVFGAAFDSRLAAGGILTLTPRNAAGEVDILIDQAGTPITEVCTGKELVVLPGSKGRTQTWFLDPNTGAMEKSLPTMSDPATQNDAVPVRELFPHCPEPGEDPCYPNGCPPPPLPPEPVDVEGNVLDTRGAPMVVQVTGATESPAAVGQMSTSAAGYYHLRLGATSPGTTLRGIVFPSARPGLRVVPTPASENFPVGTTRRDFRYCVQPGAACTNGETCCDGLTCQDKQCS